MKEILWLVLAVVLVGASFLVTAVRAPLTVASPTPTPATAVPSPGQIVPTLLSEPTPSAAPVTPSPIPEISVATPTLTLQPAHGGPGSGVRVEGDVPADVQGGNTVTLTFAVGPHRSLGDKAHTKYTGPIWPSTWPLHLDAGGRFREVVNVLRVLQAPDGDLWEVSPGDHAFRVTLDPGHTVTTAFHVDSPPPAPSVTPAAEVIFRGLWLVDAKTGWLIGERCEAQLVPTPDLNANVPSPAPPACQGLVARTVDGGQTWSEQSLDDLIPQAIQFVDAQHGWIAATTQAVCGQTPCATVILRTVDGGHRWESTYHTHPNSPALLVRGQSVPPRSAALTTLAFNSAHDGWVFGRACPGDDINCQPFLLDTYGGLSWGQVPLPEGLAGYRTYSLAHPTATDGWILASFREQGPDNEPGRLLVTHDAGRTWREQPDPLGALLVQRLFFLNATTGWMIGGGQPATIEQGKELWRTTDGGMAWAEIAATGGPPGTARPLGILPSQGHVAPSAGSLEFVTAAEGWMILGRTGLWHTTDGGRTWAPVDVGQADALQGVHFVDPRVGWVVENWHLFATADGGATWHPIADARATFIAPASGPG